MRCLPLPFQYNVLPKLFHCCIRIYLSVEDIVNLDCLANFHWLKVCLAATYFGHGVNLENTSSTAKDIPRTSKQLPSPFHKVVTPCRWCK